MHMKGQDNTLYIILILLGIVILFWYTQQFIASETATLSVDTHEIAVENNTYSPGISATIERTDAGGGEATFTLMFVQTDSIYAIDYSGNRVSEVKKTLLTRGGKAGYRFRVYGDKGEERVAVYDMHVQLWSSDSKLLGDEVIRVTVE